MVASVRVLSYNIHRAIGVDRTLDVARVADVIRETDADIVGLQEVDRRFRERTKYADQFELLREELDMAGVYGTAITREPVEQSNGEPRRYGIAVLSRHPILSSQTYALTQEPDTEPRALLDTTIDCDGVQLSFATTHLGLRTSTRQKQISDVLAGTDTERQVLAGDFNATPDSDSIDALTDRFVDSFGKCAADDRLTFPSPYDEEGKRTSESNRCIDYIFCTPDVGVGSVDVIESPASDHSAVATTIVLDSRNET